MPAKKYLVQLKPEEQHMLQELIHNGTATPAHIKRAKILLKAHEGWHDAQIVAAVEVNRNNVERLRRRYAEGGIESALYGKQRAGMRRKLNGLAGATLIDMASAMAPEGHERWSLRQLANRLIELGLVDSISHEAVRRYLKKH